MSEKKEEAVNYTSWNIFKKLSEARLQVRAKMGKKSGYNPYGKFNYFELEDIIPHMLTVFNEIGLIGIEGHENPIIDPNTGIQIVPEYYTLKIYNTDRLDDKPIVFTKKQADAGTKGQVPIQAIGSESTYMRRYLWLDALEIVENDATDANIKNSDDDAKPVEQKPRMATKAQLTILRKAYPDPTPVFNWFRVNKWEELTADQASQIIARKRLGEEAPALNV